MKNYLLDTHILLWWLNDDIKLPLKVKTMIMQQNNNIFFSAASIWEISIKKSIGKLSVNGNLKESLEQSNFIELPITMDHALHIEQLPFIHHDPFDRMLIAQAAVENLVIMTQDAYIRQYDVQCF